MAVGDAGRFDRVAVVGLGYVGLPMALLCVRRGRRVVGIDKSARRVNLVRRGVSYVTDIADAELREAVGSGALAPSIAFDPVGDCGAVIVCVNTPLTPDGRPDHGPLRRAARSIAAALRPGPGSGPRPAGGARPLISIESTVGPGAIAAEVLAAFVEAGLTPGLDFFLAYSPERVDPGVPEHRPELIPKLVAGHTPECLEVALEFYRGLGLAAVAVSSIPVAEMAKLLENTYRDVNIALVNEMAEICRLRGVDPWEIVAAAATKPFGFQAFYPGPGVGGHCVPVDSVYYSAWAREQGKPALLAEQARAVNRDRPRQVVRRLGQALAEQGKALRGSRILVLGVTYKPDVGDTREAPAVEIIRLLLVEGAEVAFADPWVKGLQVGGVRLARQSAPNALGHDCVVLAVAHEAYRNLPSTVLSHPLFVDLTGSFHIRRA